MIRRSALSTLIPIVILILSSITTGSAYGAVVTSPAPVLASGGCRTGEHPATASDVPLMTAAGITGATIGMCWNPNDKNVGQSDAEAKQYLRSILCTNSQFGGAGPDGTIKGLDSKFAVCAATFLKAVSTQLPGTVPLLGGGTNAVCLREGFRTVAQQEKYAQEYRNGGGIACTKGAGCEHPRGIAIDVNTSSEANYQKLWAIAPQFSLNFYLKARDKVHFVPTSGSCSGGGTGPNGTIPQSTYDFPQYYDGGATQSQSPTTALFNGLRSVLGMAQPTPQYLQPQSVPPLPTYQPAQNSTIGSSDSYATGVTNPTLNGGNPSLSGSQNQTQFDGNGLYSTSSNSNTNNNSNIDFINSLASSLAPPTTSTGTSGPAALNQNLQNVVTGLPVNGQNNDYVSPTVLSPEIAMNAPETFGPIQLEFVGAPYSPQSTSGFQQILTRLKGILQVLLSLLQPFGRHPQNQQIID